MGVRTCVFNKNKLASPPTSVDESLQCEFTLRSRVTLRVKEAGVQFGKPTIEPPCQLTQPICLNLVLFEI